MRHIRAILFFLLSTLANSTDQNFTYNGFHPSNLTLNGIAKITSKGALQLTNNTAQQQGRAFHPYPITFKNTTNGTASSFSTTFVFSVAPKYKKVGGDGIAFTISPSLGFASALPSQFLGLFNLSNNEKPTNHIVAVEIDTIYNSEFSDLNDNHIGVDINGLHSVASSPAGYFQDSNGKFTNLSLISRKSMQIWIDYDGVQKQINVTMAPLHRKQPKSPLISVTQDLTPILVESMYVGFSASTGSLPATFSVAGWSFKVNGQSQPLSSHLPRISPKKKSKLLQILLPIILSVSCSCGCSFNRRRVTRTGGVEIDM